MYTYTNNTIYIHTHVQHKLYSTYIYIYKYISLSYTYKYYIIHTYLPIAGLRISFKTLNFLAISTNSVGSKSGQKAFPYEAAFKNDC